MTMPISASWRRPLFVGLFLLALFAGALAWLLVHEREARGWVRHTAQVREEFADYRVMALSIEVARRNYMLTGDPQHLRIYRLLAKRLPEQMALVRKLTIDNPLQQRRLFDLEVVTAEQMSATETAIAIRQSGDRETAAKLVAGPAETARTLRRMAIIKAIVDDEKALDQARQDVALGLENGTVIIVAASTLILLVITLFSARDRRRRIGLLEDVNRRLEGDNARRKVVERELALLAENATDAVFRVSLDGRFLYASPSVGEIIGLTPDDLMGRSLFSSLHPEDEAAVFTALHRLRIGETERVTTSYRVRMPRAPEQWTWMEASAGLIRDAQGDPLEIIASVRNVSRRKQLEFALREARQAAEAATIAKSTFLANMSHEIRTPMNGIVGFAELLRATSLDAEQRQHVELIADSADAMTRLLNDILDFSKVEAGQMVLASEPFDLAQTLRACVTLVTPSILKKGLDIGIDIAPDLPRVIEGDALRLRQIVLNLLGNATKFTQAGAVRLRAHRVGTGDAPALLIAVEDSGVGIPPERQKAIFDPFVQASAGTAAQFGGTGLGLPISAQLAVLMGGQLDLASEPGRGTTVMLTLPIRACVDVVPDSPDAEPDRPGPSLAPGLRVLVAEDHDVNQMLIGSMLGRLGCRVEIVPDGLQAMAKVAACQTSGAGYALLFMDLHMPELNGLDAARRIRALGIGSETLPIVALTANAYAEDIEESLAAGMQGHVAKPFKLADLEAALVRFAIHGGETVAAPASAIPAPAAKPSVGERYKARKQQTLSKLEDAATRDILDDAIIDELADLLHKLAGTAGMFGEDTLGECARALEHALRADGAAEDRAKRLAEAMPALRDAA